MASFKFKPQPMGNYSLGKRLDLEITEGIEKQVIIWSLVMGTVLLYFYIFHKGFKLLMWVRITFLISTFCIQHNTWHTLGTQQIVLLFFLKYLFPWQPQGYSCSTRDPQSSESLVVACKLLVVGSSSLTRHQTWAPCIRSAESQPLDHQGSPNKQLLSEERREQKSLNSQMTPNQGTGMVKGN